MGVVPADIGFQKWPSIGNLKSAVYHYSKYDVFENHSIACLYRPKPKLHGTNAAIRFYQSYPETHPNIQKPPQLFDWKIGGVDAYNSGNIGKTKNKADDPFTIVAQSRNRDIHVGKDNYGFAQWVVDNYDSFQEFMRVIPEAYCTTVYGEWAGKGILDNAAICDAPRGFHIFAVQSQDYEGNIFHLEVFPDQIEHQMRDILISHDDIHVLPWIGKEITLNVFKPETMNPEIDHINHMVQLGEQSCLYTKNLYDVEGPLEGYVYYPVSFEWPVVDNIDEQCLYPLMEKYTPREWFSMFAFKAKGEAHRVTKTAAAVDIDPVKIKKTNEFIDMFCTEQRFKQALEETKARTKKQTKDFIKWVKDDVFKESKIEVEESELDWDYLAKYVGKSAAKWYLQNGVEE